MADKSGDYLNKDLELFLWKLSPPNTPSYNINTDLKVNVRLWFHNGIGQIIKNPFLPGGGKVDKFQTVVSGDFQERNKELEAYGHAGLFAKGDVEYGWGEDLGNMCFDLTPFVQSVSLPEIGTSTNPDVETLLGNMKVGAFSPYSSDGGRDISFTLLDTQYSVLDAIFYPWLKMIGNSKWYSSATAQSEHSTPYPICTVEVSTPMRFYPAGALGSATIGNYVYEYIGARPKTYDIPEINNEGRSSLTRRLTMLCDLVLVDMQADSIVAETAAGLGILESPEGGAPTLDLTPNNQIPTLNENEKGAPPASVDDKAATDLDKNIKDTQSDIDTTEADAERALQGFPPGSSDETGPSSGGMDGGDSGGEDGGEGSADDWGVDDFQLEPFDSPAYADIPLISSGSNDPLSAPAPTSTIELLRRDDPTEEDQYERSFKAVEEVNRRYYNVMMALKRCMDRDPFDYPSMNVSISIDENLSNDFDIIQVRPIIDSATIGKFDGLEEAVRQVISDMGEQITHHYAPFTVYGGKLAGMFKECKSDEGTSPIENYGRINTMIHVLNRIKAELAPMGEFTSPFLAMLAYKALKSLEKAPNNSFAFHLEDKCNLWNVGVYLTPIHNMLKEVGQFPNAEVIQPEQHPFLFRYEQFKRRRNEHGEPMEDSMPEAMLMMDLLRMHQAEKKEEDLGGGNSIGSVSFWEIIDDDFNHTGVYWCKLWVRGGHVYFFKVNYEGDVLKSDLFQEGVLRPDALEYVTLPQEGQGDDAPPPVALPWLIRSKSKFSRETIHWVFNTADGVQVMKHGQRGEHYNPLTAIIPCKSYVKATECDSKQRPTGFWHYEEKPIPGDKEYENAVEKDEAGNVLSYTMHRHVEGQELQIYYTLEPRTAYVVQSALDREIRPLAYMRMGECPVRKHPKEGQDAFEVLIVKHRDCWEGSPMSPSEYKTIHTTNDMGDLFDQYIPTSVEYVAQYLHHKKRANIAGLEQAKFRQFCGGLSSRMMKMNADLKTDSAKVDKVVNDENLNDFFTLCFKIIELSNKYNSLTDSEIKLESKVEILKKEYEDLSNEMESHDEYKELPQRVKLLDSVQLARIAYGKAEHRLESLRLEQGACSKEYNECVGRRDALLAGGLQDIINNCARVVYDHVMNSWLLDILSNSHTNLLGSYERRMDRWKMMQRLIAFFDRDIQNIDKAVDTAGLNQLILLADWKAWVSENLTPEEKQDANAVSYRLRTAVKLPQLRKKLAALKRKRERISNIQDRSTELVYDVTYAVPGYMPPDDREQKPMEIPTPEPEDIVNPTKDELYERCLVQVLPVYKELHPDFDGYTEDQLLNSLLLVVASPYLTLQNTAMQQEMVKAKELIEKNKALRDEFKASANKELELLQATKEKRAGILQSIAALDRANNDLVKKAELTDLEREETKQFRKNVMHKVDLQNSFDEVNSVYQDMMKHYEQGTMDTLANYDDNVQLALDKYDSLMEELMESIDFKQKIIDMAQDLETLGKYK